MNSTAGQHPDGEVLLRLLDDDVSSAEARLIDGHLAACFVCRTEFEELKAASSEYLQFHETVLKPALPPPPRDWDRLELRSTRRRAFPFAWQPWLAAAAAAAVIILVVLRFERAPAVKAAELLRKATAREHAAAARPRAIRIQTRRHKWNRPARLGNTQSAPEAAALRQLFESAGYNWEDPLSADAFARWHDRLPTKRDQVETTSGHSAGESYVIRTTTNANPITGASLTLRATDLHAVACTLRFGVTETVEMTEVAGEMAAPPPAPAAPAAAPVVQPRPPVIAPGAASPGDELLVIAALHRIGADLGEPIDVRREGEHVLVNASGLGPQRQEQIRAALSGIPVARFQVGDVARPATAEVERRPVRQVDTANSLFSELETASPDAPSTAALSDQAVASMETVLERAYALRALARRYPVEIAARLSPGERAILNGIARDHLESAASPVAVIAGMLAPILPRAAPGLEPGGGPWQEIAEAMPDDARRLDQALNAPAAPGGTEGRKLRAAQALADLNSRLARLRALLSQ